jgi:sarcosine oxidase subunit beta
MTMRTAEVLIAGAGVIGASIAHHLATRGVRNIVVVDRAAHFGAGSTGRATGGFRAQFPTAPNVRLSLLSREQLLRFRDETGVDPGFAQHGYLFLTRSAAVLEALRQAIAVQHDCGARDARIISAEEARAINPFIEDEALIGAAFSPADGFIKPLEILRGYAESAQRLGVEFVFDSDVRGFTRACDRIAIVRTSAGDFAAEVVVNAGGAWAASMCGVPVTPLERSVLPTVETDVLPASMPMTIWTDDGFHLRVRDHRVLLLAPPESFASVEEVARSRVPVLREVAVDRAHAWSGLYEMSPDRHVILGRSPEYENLFLACGSSGHGVMHSPAIGQLLAEMITGAPTAIDVHALRPSRFAEGEAIEGPELL